MSSNQTTPKPTKKAINQRLYMTHIVQCLYGRYPDTEFSLKILPYHDRKSLRISWCGRPEKNEVRDYLEVYRGAEIDKNGIAEPTPTLFSLPNGSVDFVYWGFDHLILVQRQLEFI